MDVSMYEYIFLKIIINKYQALCGGEDKVFQYV